MKRKSYYKMVTTIVNRIKNDNQTQPMHKEIEFVLNKYKLSMNHLPPDININYKKVLLSLYYDISRMMQIPYEVYPDYFGDNATEITHTYITDELIRCNMYEEYAIYNITKEEYEKAKSDFGLL